MKTEISTDFISYSWDSSTNLIIGKVLITFTDKQMTKRFLKLEKSICKNKGISNEGIYEELLNEMITEGTIEKINFKELFL